MKKKESENALKGMTEEIRNYLWLNRSDLPEFKKHLSENKAPSAFIKQHLSQLFGKYIRSDMKDHLLWTVDNVRKWQYSMSYYRRSYRSSYYVMYEPYIKNVIQEFAKLSYFDSSPENIISGNLSDVELSYYNSYYSPSYENILACELDKNNDAVLKIVEDKIFGETVNVDIPLIRGIMKSENKKAHEMLGKLLLAARLQEGLRQAVCENADCGTIDAFSAIVNVICENDLIRFSAVKRAMWTWCGIYTDNTTDLERISGKMINLIHECLNNNVSVEMYMQSEDAIELYIALWVYSLEDIVKGSDKCDDIMKNGSHHQRLVCGVFVESFDNYAIEHSAGKYAVLNFNSEPDTMAVCLNKFMSGFSGDIRDISSKMLPNEYSSNKQKRSTSRVYPELNDYFDNTAQALQFYDILKNMLELVPKKELIYDPCVFPWYCARLKKSDIYERMMWIACALKDNDMIDEMCKHLPEVGDLRDNALVMLTAFPQTNVQQTTTLAALADRETYTRRTAQRLVKYLELTEENYTQLEEMLRFKSADIRTNVIELLSELDDDSLYSVCSRLLTDKKSEKRLAGLDIVLNLKKDDRTQLFEKTKAIVSEMNRDISKEAIIIDEIIGTDEPVQDIYEDKAEPLPEINMDFIAECDKLFVKVFPNSQNSSGIVNKLKKRLNSSEADHSIALDKLYKLIQLHAKDEVVYNGEKTLLENLDNFWRFNEFPLEDVWDEFYKTEIKTPELLIRMMLSRYHYNAKDLKREHISKADAFADKLLGEHLESKEYGNFNGIVHGVLNHLCGKYIEHSFKSKLAASLTYKLCGYPAKQLIYKLKDEESVFTIDRHSQLGFIISALYVGENNEDFKNIFPIRLHYSSLVFSASQNQNHVWGHNNGRFINISTTELIRACAMGMISDNEMYRWFFEELDLSDVLRSLSTEIKFIRERDKIVAASRHSYTSTIKKSNLIGNKNEEDYSDIDFKVLEKAAEVYENVISFVLRTELNRGDSETIFSPHILRIERIYGVENYVKILSAMGKDNFVRGYMYGYVTSKNECLSHLINACVPNADDTAEKLRELVSKTDITETRIIEAAMYSPEWIDITEEYLGWDGFRCGCYYFMAHMNDYFDEKRKAVTAKYSPIAIEELKAGAFDINWFRLAYDTLGEKRFSKLYNAAKYITDGGKHSRARKYADAVMGKLDAAESEKLIDDKRNKDLLMAYSLIPFNSEDELIHRYLFLQKFLKESKKFGAQRRASEASAVEIGLKNLSISAGYSDVTRLKLRMEAKMFEDLQSQFVPHDVEDVKMWLEIENGKTSIKCEKNGKMLKNVPAKLKKNEYAVTLSTTKKQLNEQYKRTKNMFEQSMEDETEFTLGEINILNTNPVALSVTENLVFVSGKKCLIIRDGNLVDANGDAYSKDESCPIRVAHPFDMYSEGTWRSYQKYLFDNHLVQPFRQVFRELYVKTDDEIDMDKTRRYAGNQILVKKTVATLKSRRWVCDVDDGLQKVCFKENIVAKLYALADWFSPSDIEAPTLEYVGFTDRLTGKPVKIKNIPDIVFSEIMRDADLAVSVCHAGDVDPEHSHSTIEMRAAILEFTLPLFKLHNCEIKGSHVFIKGSRAEYNVHLGSGICHIDGGIALNILPVHSQHRGRIFLPFADDDPKTAEIISKVLLLAEDKKIKDPYILKQINDSL